MILLLSQQATAPYPPALWPALHSFKAFATVSHSVKAGRPSVFEGNTPTLGEDCDLPGVTHIQVGE